MNAEGHHPLLRSLVQGGWSATVTVAGKTYHTEGEYPAEVVYNLAIQLADDLAAEKESVCETCGSAWRRPR